MTTVVLNTTTRKVEAFSSARDVQARAYGHDSKPALEAATVPAGIDLVHLRGYAAAGDGGAASYRRVQSEPGHHGKIQSNNGDWWELAETKPTPQMFGAKADGSSDDLESINRCGDFVNRKGLGLLYIPDGVYRVENSATAAAAVLPDDGFTGVVVYDGMTVRGQSRDKTVIRSVDGAGRRLIMPVRGEISYQIESLTLDGNKATHASGTQGIRVHSENKDVRIRNVVSRNNVSYGIGVAYDAVAPLANLNLHVSDCILEDNGEDGFDCKISERAFVERVVARNNGGAGIDVRGHYVVTSDCLAHGNATWGIASGRPTSDASGIAHHQSVNCISHDNGDVGFRFRDQADTTAQIIEYRVTNPLAYGNAAAGMAVICGRGTVVITGGASYENGTHGISILDVAGTYPDPENLHVELIGTTIRDNNNHGISGATDYPARLAVIGGRIAVAALQRGINGGFRSLRCSGVRFEGGDYGIVWSNTAGACEDGEITGCVFTGQAVWGLSASVNSRGILTGCTFRGTGGFRTVAAALDWYLSNNDFSGVTGTRISDASGTVRASSPFNGTFQIAPDTAVTIDFPDTKTGLLAVWCDTNPGFPPSPNGLLRFRTGASANMSEVALVNATNIALTTGALSGTTGASGDITFSAHSDNRIHIENRAAATRTVRYQVMHIE